ncbi:MAG: MarR family transcriptional regulator [Bacteroidetes bacterium]|nr:MAG: MarR family transcriptional regulator [Bacteroidota bacterium]
MRKEETVDYNIKKAWHAINRMYNQEALKNEITTSIAFVLLNIHSTEGTPATKIAPLIGLESRSLVRMLRSMEEKRLICRKADPLDRRLVRIFLTPKGQGKKDIAYKTVMAFNQHVFNKVPQEELKVFLKVIQQINQIVEENSISQIVASNNQYETNHK